MGVVIEGVGLIAGLDHTRQPMYRQIHQAQLGVVLNLFLPVKGHGVIGLHPSVLHEVTGLHEHTAAAAGRVYVPAVLDTKKNPFSGTEIPEKGIIQGHSMSIADFGSPCLPYKLVVYQVAARWGVSLAV